MSSVYEKKLFVIFPCEFLRQSKKTHYYTIYYTLYTILTHWVVYFQVTGSVPVCCIAVGFIMTLLTVKNKKLRI